MSKQGPNKSNKKTTTKKTNSTVTKKKNSTSKPAKKEVVQKKETIKQVRIIKKINKKLTIFLIVVLGILLIFSSYAWFSSNLNVRVKTFNMIVTKNSGLTLSFDGINFDTALEISADTLIRDLRATYPNNTSQWASNGLTPVSSNGISNANSQKFNMFASEGGVRYTHKNRKNGFINTSLLAETERKEFSYFVAFDLFFKNDTGSPIADNLYLDNGTSVIIDDENASEEMQGLINSARIGFVKIGSVPHEADVTTIQNIPCNNGCRAIIYEPNSTFHTPLSIERAENYGVNLISGQRYPTYGCYREGGPIPIANAVPGSPNLDQNYFALQNTIHEDDFDTPLFTIPDGITKVRVYLWIEGQDIDSLETDSEGTSMSISINFVKDTAGYQ